MMKEKFCLHHFVAHSIFLSESSKLQIISDNNLAVHTKLLSDIFYRLLFYSGYGKPISYNSSMELTEKNFKKEN